MKLYVMSGLASALLVFSPYVLATDDAQTASVSQTSSEQSGSLELAAAPIKSPRDLELHLKSHPGDSPLMVMAPLNRRLFLDSLRFNEKGVTTLRYDVLESLTPTEAYQILSLFGMQGLTPQLNLRGSSPLDKKVMSITPSLLPLKDYYCEGKGTCRQGSNVACGDAC